jgi:hypothetical protein
MRIAPCAVLLAAWLPAQALSETPQSTCGVGPVTRSYGGTDWLLYSCDNDDGTLVLLSAPGSPASPFYFAMYPDKGRYQLEGEGTGDRQATDRAYADLRRLTEPDIAALIAETKRQPKSK